MRFAILLVAVAGVSVAINLLTTFLFGPLAGQIESILGGFLIGFGGVHLAIKHGWL